MNTCTEQRHYDFSELSDDAKEKARDVFRSNGYPFWDWWDSVFEDVNAIAKILGLDITERKTNKSGRVYDQINIYFSGFWSQGDGASFAGRYQYNPRAVDEIIAYCSDDELIRIATELTVMQTTQRLLGLDHFHARITTSAGYCHSGSMDFEIDDYGSDEIGEVDEDKFAQLMRDFADWIYKVLEKEHDHFMSDEVVDEELAEEKFDEDGIRV